MTADLRVTVRSLGRATWILSTYSFLPRALQDRSGWGVRRCPSSRFMVWSSEIITTDCYWRKFYQHSLAASLPHKWPKSAGPRNLYITAALIPRHSQVGESQHRKQLSLA